MRTAKNVTIGVSGLAGGFLKSNIYTKSAAIMFGLAKLQFALTLLSMAISFTLPLIFWVLYVIFVWASISLAIKGWIENIDQFEMEKGKL
jgi:hypothetical protein